MLAVEFSCHHGDDMWMMSEKELFELSLPYLENDGIISREQVSKLFVVRAAHAYPIRYYDFQGHLDNVLGYVRKQPNLDVLGRTGEYRYIDSDQCMERAFTLAEQIADVFQA